jgi:hypothetical protein
MNPVFGLNEKVKISCSGERGIVVGYAQYVSHHDQCLVRYKAADGRAVEQWWDVDALETDVD